jgi:hypothetical protein
MDAVPGGYKQELKRSQTSMIDRQTQGVSNAQWYDVVVTFHTFLSLSSIVYAD